MELADGDPEAIDPVVAHHGVVFETAELTDTHAGAGQQFDHEATAQVRIERQGGHELRRRGVVQELGQGLVEGGEVARVDEQAGRGVVVLPFHDALEEGPHGAEAVPDRQGGHPLPLLPGRAASHRLKSSMWTRPMAATRDAVRIGGGDPMGEEP